LTLGFRSVPRSPGGYGPVNGVVHAQSANDFLLGLGLMFDVGSAVVSWGSEGSYVPENGQVW
jgi:hypothetical protein